MATHHLSTDEFLSVTTTPTVMRAGVEISEHLWGDLCSGTREQLVAAGIYHGPFPGDDGKNKTTLNTSQDGYKRVRVRRRGKHTFFVEFEFLADGKAQRLALQKARVAHAGRTKALHLAQEEIDLLPKTAAAYRLWFADFFDVTTKLYRSGSKWADGYGGYAFTPGAKAEIDAALDEVRAAIVRAAVFQSDRALAQNIQEIKARLIRDDDAKAFVQSLVAAAATE